jgi:MFS-type transporter involved in bile tolerance (Atg22 family)
MAGFSGYAGHVRVDYALVGGIATAAIAGSVLGSRLAHRIDPTSLRRAFAGFVLAMAALILTRETDTWLATARAALPDSVQQLAFVLLALAVGIAAGRASNRAGI